MAVGRGEEIPSAADGKRSLKQSGAANRSEKGRAGAAIARDEVARITNGSRPGKSLGTAFESFSNRVTGAVGRPWAFLIALGGILVWLVSGPFLGFGNTWQLWINTITTIITFLMVFLIQQTQNKDTKAIELKLDELVAATEGASNSLISVEDLGEEELDTLRSYYRALVEMAKQDRELGQTHSVDEADKSHDRNHGKEEQDAAAGLER